MKIKSRVCVDEVAVKKFNNEAQDWTATCPVCHVELTCTIEQLKQHRHD